MLTSKLHEISPTVSQGDFFSQFFVYVLCLLKKKNMVLPFFNQLFFLNQIVFFFFKMMEQLKQLKHTHVHVHSLRDRISKHPLGHVIVNNDGGRIIKGNNLPLGVHKVRWNKVCRVLNYRNYISNFINFSHFLFVLYHSLFFHCQKKEKN